MASKPTAQRQAAPDFVRAGLRQAIFDGQYEPGEQLRQDEIGERFGTSRIPVREALRQLEAEGLVALQANKGAVVSRLSLDEVLEFLDIRIGLECRALKLAIPNMAEEDFLLTAEILENYDSKPLPRQWSEMNERFHFALYAPCHRPRLMSMIQLAWGQIGRFTRMQVSMAAGKERPQSEHHKLLTACRKQDVVGAVRLLENHIEQTQKSLLAAARHRVRPKVTKKS